MVNLTPSQKSVVNKAIEWYRSDSSQIFQYSGAAGTGKSFVLLSILKAINVSMEDVAPMAYTGAAALIMKKRGFKNAKTIHSWIYQLSYGPLYNNDGTPKMEYNFNRPVFGYNFYPKPFPKNIKLIIVDEASMVPGYIGKELNSKGLKIIACGDNNQLPPVEDNKLLSESFYLTENCGPVYYLKEIVRQSKDSGIPEFAQAILNGFHPMGNNRNIFVVSRDKFNYKDLSKPDVDIIICGTNKTRQLVTSSILDDLHISGKFPVNGEPLICRKNNWKLSSDNGKYIGIANGLIGKVTNYPGMSSYSDGNISINFQPNGMDDQFSNVPINFDYFKAPFTNKPSTELIYKYKSVGELFEPAYCITTHLSQGSEFKFGIYFEEGFPHMESYNNRLNYTAVTRFSDGLIYVKKPTKYRYTSYRNF